MRAIRIAATMLVLGTLSCTEQVPVPVPVPTPEPVSACIERCETVRLPTRQECQSRFPGSLSDVGLCIKGVEAAVDGCVDSCGFNR